ncbi:MAG TPA: gamma-glutamyltransferase [Terriglobales bacterium]|nr:gamma-glutamyltransferase [Terriglobales bacterium]
MKPIRPISAVVTVLLLSSAALAAGVRPEHASKAMVVSVHELASRAGVEMMQAGGNAVDAAVATGFALAVVHPVAGNIGGGGFLLMRMANGEARFLDFREKAPARATANMYLDAEGNVIKDASTVGYKASGVPGSVAGLAYAQKKWGKLPLARVMQPAIRLAREGYALSYNDASSFRNRRLTEFPESKRIFQREGNYYQQGDIFRQPELAKTLERIAANPDEFYHGALAKEIAAAVQQGGGLITTEDLAAYEVKERSPVRGTYRGLEIIGAPPPSSGGVALIEALNILEGYDLRAMGAGSADAIHVTTEAMRRAFFDRSEFMGDPDFAKVPVASLVDKKYGAAWRDSIAPQRATLSAGLRRPEAFHDLDRVASFAAAGAEPSETTHYSVVDEDGNAVAVTTTLNSGFGSKVTLPGLGFLMNDEMDDFATKPGVPNSYGLIQGPANAIGPGKRPLSAMTPTIVLKDGKLFLVLGSPGGPRIISTVLNILTGVVDHGLNIQEAVNAPRFHHQYLPDLLYMERTGFSPDTQRILEQRGHHIVTVEKDSPSGRWSDGECIMIDPKNGERLGASDPRNDTGKAVGY